MQLQVNRVKKIDTDRRGTRGARYSMTFRLLITDAERTTVYQCGLNEEVLFQSQTKVVFAREAIEGEAAWQGLSLSLALSIQNSMLENCRAFAKLVRTAETFEGLQTVELSS